MTMPPKLPEATELLRRMRMGETARDIALECGARQHAVHIKLKRAGYSKKDWQPVAAALKAYPRQKAPIEVLLDAIAANERIMRAQRAVLTRSFIDVTSMDIAFAVDSGWLPKRFKTDPLGMGAS